MNLAFSDRLARQLARPNGWAGRLLGGAMDLANRRPVRLALDRLAPQMGECILDIGCGTGMALQEIHRRARCDLVGVDPSPTMLAAARARLGNTARCVEASLGDLPLQDGMVDAVLALNVLYFCDHEGVMLQDLFRVLRPGGRLVAYVTHRASMDRWAFASAGYHRLYDADELRQALELGGFAADSIIIEDVGVGAGVRGLIAMAVR